MISLLQVIWNFLQQNDDIATYHVRRWIFHCCCIPVNETFQSLPCTRILSYRSTNGEHYYGFLFPLQDLIGLSEFGDTRLLHMLTEYPSIEVLFEVTLPKKQNVKLQQVPHCLMINQH